MAINTNAGLYMKAISNINQYYNNIYGGASATSNSSLNNNNSGIQQLQQLLSGQSGYGASISSSSAVNELKRQLGLNTDNSVNNTTSASSQRKMSVSEMQTQRDQLKAQQANQAQQTTQGTTTPSTNGNTQTNSSTNSTDITSNANDTQKSFLNSYQAQIDKLASAANALSDVLAQSKSANTTTPTDTTSTDVSNVNSVDTTNTTNTNAQQAANNANQTNANEANANSATTAQDTGASQTIQDKLSSAVNTFAQTFNDTLSFLQNNSSQGYGVNRALEALKNASSNGIGADLMRQGINVSRDSQIKVGNVSFNGATQDNIKSVVNSLSNSRMLSLTNQAIGTARGQSSASLLSNSLQSLLSKTSQNTYTQLAKDMQSGNSSTKDYNNVSNAMLFNAQA